MTLPNQLTILRLFLVLPFIIVAGFILSYPEQSISFYDFNHKTIIFLINGILFFLAMITDWLDGFLARKYQVITTFGKLFDPIADKFMTSAAFIFLAILKLTPFFVPIIFILRDILVDGSRNLAAKHNRQVQANIWGKLKTILQTVALLILFFVTPLLSQGATRGFVALQGHWQLWLVNVVTLLAMLLSLHSGFIYVSNVKDLIKIK